jgi:hypothetical protein
MMITVSVRFVMTLGLALLTGCTSDTVRLRHPQTGKTAHCGLSEGMSPKTAVANRERCIEHYQSQGYEQR